MGETIRVLVTSVLNSAGRMIFGKPKLINLRRVSHNINYFMLKHLS